MTNAQRNAVKEETVSFSYGELNFEIPTSENWPIDVLENFEDGKMVGALRALLGQDQWDAFKAKHNKMGELRELFDAAGEAVGAKN